MLVAQSGRSYSSSISLKQHLVTDRAWVMSLSVRILESCTGCLALGHARRSEPVMYPNQAIEARGRAGSMAASGLNMARDAAKQIINGRRARNRQTNIERSGGRLYANFYRRFESSREWNAAA